MKSVESTSTNVENSANFVATMDATNHNWHALESADAIEQLSSNADTGLTKSEVASRLEEVGPNALAEGEHATWLQVLVRQFVDVLIGILVVAAVLSFAVGDVGDGLTIFAIIVLNGVLGFVQEWRAEQALAVLQQMLAPRCKVLRDDEFHEIDASGLVPGDIIRLDTGDRVPADARILSHLNLSIDEAALTGESEPVRKSAEPVSADAPLSERTSMAFTGTAVTSGHGLAVVVETGMRTEFGKIADLTSNVRGDETHLQKQLGHLGTRLGLAAVGVSILIAVLGTLTGREVIEMFMTGVALAVAVVPEGLPAVVTITLALGVRQMLKRKALVRKLQAAETLGAATVICTDKTGTLTKNEMTVQHIWTASGAVEVTGVGYEPEGEFQIDGGQIDAEMHPHLIQLLECGVRCNDAQVVKDEAVWKALGAPTEASLLTAALKAGLDVTPQREVVHEVTFDSERKRMSILERADGELRVWVKGAPEMLLDHCTHIATRDGGIELDSEKRHDVEAALVGQAEQGRRTLGLAWKPMENATTDAEELESGLTFLGFVGIIDPPREQVPSALKMAQKAGIDTIMITGDAPTTAMAIAKSVGLDAEFAVTGPELEAMTREELEEVLKGQVLFARATPEHKLRIVEVLQDRGEIVAMTGDGVNDAPALKKADIGIAMGQRGTEVARGASEMVLIDDNFASIVSAVEEGRRQYDNIQKFVRYLLSSNFGEVVAIAASIIVGGPLILMPVQILWANLVTDGVTAVALGAEPVEPDTMERPPRDPKANLIDWMGVGSILLLGGYLGGATYAVFHWYLQGDPSEVARAQTMAFTGLIVFEKINVFNFRSLHMPLFRMGFFSNPWVIGAWLLNMGLQIAAVYTPFLQDLLHTVPLTLNDWGVLFAVGLPIFVVGEFVKVIWRRVRV